MEIFRLLKLFNSSGWRLGNFMVCLYYSCAFTRTFSAGLNCGQESVWQLDLCVDRNWFDSWTYLWPGVVLAAGLACGQESFTICVAWATPPGLFQLDLFMARNRCGSWTYLWPGIGVAAGLMCGQELIWQLDLFVARNCIGSWTYVWPGIVYWLVYLLAILLVVWGAVAKAGSRIGVEYSP